MKIFAIKDKSLSADKVLGYLIYYENAHAFYIELPEDADVWETPLLLSSFVKRGEYSIGSYWSRLWVEQRIIPQDRQNIGQILRDNHLYEYDEFELLKLSMGRCAQDQCYLEEVYEKDLPAMLAERWKLKLDDAIPLKDGRLLAFFRNGEVRLVDVKKCAEGHSACLPYINNPDRFLRLNVQPDGYGVMWSEQAVLSDRELYACGTAVPLSLDDFCSFVQNRVVNSSEACKLLDCSRQNIDDLTRRGRLHPIRTDAKNKLYLKNEVMQRKKGM